MSSGGAVRVYNRDMLNEVCQATTDPSTENTENFSSNSLAKALGSEASSKSNLSSVVPVRMDVTPKGAASIPQGFVSSATSVSGRKKKDGGGPGQGLQTGIGMGKIGMGMEDGKSTKLQTIAANEERYRQMHEKARREAERRIQENAKRRELQFNEMFANVQNGIDRKSGILKEVDQLVEQSDRSKDKRARALYQSWNEQVYSNIQKQIQDQLSALTTEEIEARLNRKYDAFLQASNQKAGVFMNGNQSSTAAGQATGGGLTGAGGTGGAGVGGGSDKLGTIKVCTAKLNDPLKRSLLKIKEEKSIITKGRSPISDQQKEQLGRECLDTRLWGDDMLHTTPYAHILKEYYDPSLESKVHMNHFQYPKGNEVAFENFPKGKREKPDQSTRDKATFGLIQMKDANRTHTDLLKAGDTHGDLFLLSRGKLMLSHAHEKANNMFHLVGHTCSTEQPGVSGGDMWLEAKGKQRRAT